MMAAAPTSPVTWVLAAVLGGDRGPRSTGADRKSLEQPRGDAGGADPDHLAVAVDLLATPGREDRGGGDGVRERDEGDAQGSREEDGEVIQRDVREA